MMQKQRISISCLLTFVMLLIMVLPALGQAQEGDVFLVPTADIITSNAGFCTELRVNTGTADLGAFGVEINYNPRILYIDTIRPGGGAPVAGNFLVSNPSTAGTAFVSGFHPETLGRGAAVLIADIHWRVLQSGPVSFTLTIRDLVDSAHATIGIPTGITTEIMIYDILPGDVDDNGIVDIVDALKTARYYVGYDPEVFLAPAADVNSDNSIDIIDALMIAQFYVGLLDQFPASVPTSTPRPTPTPVVNVGRVWLSPSQIVTRHNSSLDTFLYVNTGQQLLTAYSCDLLYNPVYIRPDTSMGTEGVIAGSEGFLSTVNHTPGLLSVTGFDTSGTGPDAYLQILRIYWITTNSGGSTQLDLKINSLLDETGIILGTPIAGELLLKIAEFDRGDVNRDDQITIVDALMIAQYYVGLSLGNFTASMADVNSDGSISIVDALLVSQYVADIIDHF